MNYRDHRESKGQVERLARLYHRKFSHAFGASLSVDDLSQEFWITWQKVVERFDPSRGFEFKALLGVSIKNRAIEMAKFHGRRTRVVAGSLDDTVGVGEESWVNNLASSEPSAEVEVIRRERTAHLMKNMDGRLRKMVELLAEEPEALQREVKAAQAKAEFGASMGINTVAPKELSLSMLTELCGMSRCSRYRLMDQMKEIEADYDY
ncbi:hypothetical protein HGG70_07045 [Rhodobacteraceae bacterium R_SAG4]|nr:hypothetical protein [Rhodobacteraceae bacterium R_SAG4]